MSRQAVKLAGIRRPAVPTGCARCSERTARVMMPQTETVYDQAGEVVEVRRRFTPMCRPCAEPILRAALARTDKRGPELEQPATPKRTTP